LRIFYFSFSALILSIVYFYFGQTIFEISPKTNLLIFLFSFILFLILSRFLVLRVFQKRKVLVYFLGNEELRQKLSKDLENHPFFVFQGDWRINSFQDLNKLSILVTDPNYHLKTREFQAILNSEIAVFDFIDFYERFFGRIPLEAVTSDWLIRQITTGQTKIYFYFKRFFDLLLSTFLFIFLFLPLFLPISILIFLSDPGPIFFKQQRVGYKKKNFELIKFRTMRQDKETEGKWAVGNEERRIFLFGRFLRKTHLDELPQIFNLLKGELTLVGPRPEQPKIFEDLEKEIPFYALRVLLPPGLTGWAQVNYKYPENLEETKTKLEYDLYYLKNANLFLDCLIIIKTLQKILTF
jgi:lipopolysaccharide/colanic/teichoic acid biosynthesis glycosyltransferase